MTSSIQPPDDLKSLTALAKSFADRDMFEEASDLFQLALRFDPENLGLKLNLAQVRYQQRKQQGHQKDGEEIIREQLRRNAIDAAHFLGLAQLYEERGKPVLAAECLAIAQHKDLVNPWIHKLRGQLLLRDQSLEEARDELRTAQRYNPFDREIVEMLGQVQLEMGEPQASLETTIDAFLLLPDGGSNTSQGPGKQLSQRISRLRSSLKLDGAAFKSLFNERRDKLQMAFERLEMQRDVLLSEAAKSAEDAPTERDSQNGRIELAARLREFGLWRRLDDEQIFQLTQTAHVERHRVGDKIFEYGHTGADIYVLEQGRVTVRRPTSYGSYELGVLEDGAVFGEVNFVSRSERSADVIAVTDCTFVRFDSGDLEALLQEHPDLGVQIYLSFWQGLAQKLRGANEQLRTFFADEQMPEDLLKMRQENRGAEGDIEVKSSEVTLKLLREQGLSGAELTTLANFSQVKRFPAGNFIFHEGDEGAEMYVVLEGKVMISKFIPGGGEEALAILRRGDFFGEMALIDGEPRSADAKAFQGEVTLVAFNDESLKEVLAMEPRAALDFMALLCRLICKRLREIDEKVTGWRIMSGARPEDAHSELADGETADLKTA